MIRKILYLISFILLVMPLFPIGERTDGANSDPVKLFQTGRSAYLQGEYFLAIEQLKKVLDLNPYYYDGILLLARCFYSLDEYDEAVKYVERAKKLNAKDPELMNLEGMIFIGLKEPQKANELFNKVLLLQPNNLEARFGLAELDIVDGKKRQAAEKFFKTLEAAPKNKIALVQLVRLYFDLKEYAAAEEYLELALRYHAEDPEIHYEAGKYYFYRGEYSRARRYLSMAMALKKDFYKGQQLMGILSLKEGKYSEALNMLKSSLDIGDDFEKSLSRYFMAIAAEKNGDVAGALEHYKLAIRLRYEDEISRLGSEALALKHLSDKDPARHDLAEYHFRNGENLYDLNFFRNALTEYRRCLQLNPDHKEARLHFSGIYRTIGYPIKYYYMLRVLRDYYKYNDPSLLDEIDIYQSLLYDTVTLNWNKVLNEKYSPDSKESIFNQYNLPKNQYKLSVYTLPGENSMVHLFADEFLSGYFKELLSRSEGLNIVEGSGSAASYEEVFRRAKSEGSDYFLILGFKEDERSFEVEGKFFLTRTGTEMKSFKIYRTGNRKVEGALYSLSDSVLSLFPVKGTLLIRNFGKGLINLGRLEGIKKDDKLLIIKKNKMELDTSKIGYIYDEADHLGEFVVTNVDENLAEGIIKKKSFFDYINPGDELLLITEEPASDNNSQ